MFILMIRLYLKIFENERAGLSTMVYVIICKFIYYLGLDYYFIKH